MGEALRLLRILTDINQQNWQKCWNCLKVMELSQSYGIVSKLCIRIRE